MRISDGQHLNQTDQPEIGPLINQIFFSYDAKKIVGFFGQWATRTRLVKGEYLERAQSVI